MRIEVTEAIEIIGYAIGDQAATELKRHFLKYNDWKRVKDLALKEIIRRTHEHNQIKKQLKRAIETIDSEKQVPLFPPKH